MADPRHPFLGSRLARDLGALLVLLAFPLLILRDPVIGGQSFAINDMDLFLPWGHVNESVGEIQNNSGTDGTLTFYPRKVFSREEFRNGRVPLWNPHHCTGLPFQADPHTALFHPPNLLYNVMAPERAMALLALLQLSLSGFLAYAFLRNAHLGRMPSLVGALLYQGNPFFLTHIVNPTNVDSGLWLPGALLFLDRGIAGKRPVASLVAFAGCIAFSILGGFPPVAVYAWYMVAIYGLFRIWRTRDRSARKRGLGFLAGGLTLGLMIAAVQILPAMELGRFSGRKTVSYEDFRAIFLPFESLVSLAIPDFFGLPTRSWLGLFCAATRDQVYEDDFWRNSYLENTGYLGILALVLAGIQIYRSPRRPITIFWLSVAMVSLSMTLGLPTFRLAYHLFPGFTFSRICRIQYLYGTGIAVLAAYGLQGLWIRRPRWTQQRLTKVVVGYVAFCSVVLAIALPPHFDKQEALRSFGDRGHVVEHSSDWLENRQSAWDIAWRRILWNHDTWLRSVLLFLGFLGASIALVGAYSAGWLSRRVFGALCVYLVTLDLAAESRGFLTFQEEFYPSTLPGSLTMLREQSSKASPETRIVRYGDFREILPPNSTVVYGLDDVQGANALLPQRYGEFMALIDPDMFVGFKKIIAVPHMTSLDSPLLDLLGVRYVLSTRYIPTDISNEDAHIDALKLVYNGEIKVYENADALPRAFVVDRVRKASPGKATLTALADPEFDPAREVVLPLGAESPGENKGRVSSAPPGTVDELDYTSSRVVADLTMERPGYLVLTDALFPGWTAEVNGEPTSILRANHVFRAVFLPAGAHRVTMEFRPHAIRIGGIITLITILGCIVATLRNRSRSCTS